MAIGRFSALAVAGALSGTGVQAAITLSGDTNRSEISTMSLGDQVQLTF